MSFQINPSAIPGCFEIVPRILRDERGLFVKTFHQEFFSANGLNTHWAEEYFSVSYQGVLRGFHFQTPPHDHEKMIYCPQGQVFDVVLDLRRGSPTYGRHCSFDLNQQQANMVYIPRGCAHGFYTGSDSATMMYKVSTVYAPENDSGILWSSAGVEWPDKQPTISARDAGFTCFSSFLSPFTFNKVPS